MKIYGLPHHAKAVAESETELDDGNEKPANELDDDDVKNEGGGGNDGEDKEEEWMPSDDEDFEEDAQSHEL